MPVQICLHEFVAGLANEATVSIQYIVLDEGLESEIWNERTEGKNKNLTNVLCEQMDHMNNTCEDVCGRANYSEYTTHCSKSKPLKCSEPWCLLRWIWKAFFEGDMVLQSGHWYLRLLLRWTSLTCRDKFVFINLLQGLQIWPPSVYSILLWMKDLIPLSERKGTKPNMSLHCLLLIDMKLHIIYNTLFRVQAPKLFRRVMPSEVNLKSILWWWQFIAKGTLVLEVATEVDVSHMAV